MSIANFFIIGAAKSGTTSLQSYLNQHPDICFSKNKEPNYYAFAGQELPENGPVDRKLLYQLRYSNCVTEFEQYKQQFSHANTEQVLGDASVRYLYYPDAPIRIEQKVKNAKFIAILREPVSRLYSHYCMNKQFHLEPLGLYDAIDAEKERIAAKWGWDWHYTEIGLYSAQLARYYKRFSDQQIKVYLYDDFVDNPQKVMTEICQFLEVDSNFIADMSKRGKVPYWSKNAALDKWLTRKSMSRSIVQRAMTIRLSKKLFANMQKRNGFPVPKLSQSDKQALSLHFQSEVESLGDLLGRKIPWQYK
jgi:hypothetical protein